MTNLPLESRGGGRVLGFSKHRATLPKPKPNPYHFAGCGGWEKQTVPTFTWLGLTPNPLPANQQVQL